MDQVIRMDNVPILQKKTHTWPSNHSYYNSNASDTTSLMPEKLVTDSNIMPQ